MKISQLCRRETWRRGRNSVHVTAWKAQTAWTFRAGVDIYQVHRHSTRSKYRGYYVIHLKFDPSRNSWGEVVRARNLTKEAAVGYIKLIKGL